MSDLGPGLSIRHFGSNDQDLVRTLILDGLAGHFSLIDTALNSDLDEIGSSYLEEGHIFLVAELAGEIVGTGALISEGDDQGRIVRVSVAGDLRRKGIGGAIVTRLIEHARGRGYERLLVETNLDWFEAIALYKNCGFEPYARDQESVHLKLELPELS